MILGRAEEAIESFNSALQLDDNSLCAVCAFEGRGLAYAMKGDYERALDDYSQALELDPNHIITYRARTDFSKAIDIKDGNTRAYFFRGMAYKGMGETAKAIADMETALTLDLDPTIEQQVMTELELLREQK